MNKIRTEYCKENGYTYLGSDNPNIKKYLNYLEEKLVKAINYSRCSTQLKSVDIISFDEWKKRFVVKTETNNVYEFRGDFVLGTDLEFAYNKDVELFNSLIV